MQLFQFTVKNQSSADLFFTYFFALVLLRYYRDENGRKVLRASTILFKTNCI